MTCFTMSGFESNKSRVFSLIKKSFFVFAIAFGIGLVSLTSAHAEDTMKLKEAMQSLKDQTAALGAASLDGENLMFGTTKVNDDYTIVDDVKAKFGGTATLFAKKDANFVRVTTNVIKEGNRAVGTILDPAGPAYAAIQKGEAFYGIVDILGKFYDTGYEPIKNEAGETIGIYYVGYAVE